MTIIITRLTKNKKKQTQNSEPEEEHEFMISVIPNLQKRYKTWYCIGDRYLILLQYTEGGDFIPFTKIGLDPDKKGIRYADLVDFDNYRGVGLFVAGYKGAKFGLFKTGGEYGYYLPQ